MDSQQIEAEFYFSGAEGVAGAVAAMGSNSEAMVLVDVDESPLRLLTFCVLRLRDGAIIAGKSACSNPSEFNAATGRKLARQDALAHLREKPIAWRVD